MGAHPRSRGENLRGLGAHGLVDGSSPLTRGKLSAEKSVFLTGRLIPAHAGKTAPSGVAGSCMPAHPRSRGENLIGVAADLSAQGSSPLTRGKPDGIHASRSCDGLIPAHAGKTCSHRSRTPIHRAHPRSRGENSSARKRPASASGSSPLTRGKLRDADCQGRI